jgi:ketosteroid isomerase-like protein
MNNGIWRVVTLVVLLFSGLLACTRVPAADPARVALEGAIQRWVTAVNAQDVATLNGMMTDDVELLDANGATRAGREAAIRELRDAASRGKLSATTREIEIADTVAWHVVALAQTQKNQDVRARGQALEIWKRENGAWKLHRRMSAGITPDSLTRPSPKDPVLDRPTD